MKRKISSIDSDETRLSKLLFNKTEDFVKKLKPLESPLKDIELKPVWDDEDDEKFSSYNKMADKAKLKQKYESLMGTPGWAKITNNKVRSEEDDDSEILRTVGHIQRKKSEHLSKNFLEIKPLPAINSNSKTEGQIIPCVDFHPKLSVALVGGNTGKVSLFSIGADVNNKLHSFKLNKWKLFSAQFSPNETEVYLGCGQIKSYCVYDLIKAQPKLTQFPSIVRKPTMFRLSPDGKYIATSDGFDEIYLICTVSQELLKSLKNNFNVQSLTFSNDNEKLYCYGVQGEVAIWDLSTFRVIRKFYDVGCVNGSCITASACGKLLATGSAEGIVNIYETSTFHSTEPIPIKTISNLSTKISHLKFNSTSEILSMSSETIQNAIRLVHIPSYHVFNNFPDQNGRQYRIKTVNFSPNSGYMAIGNYKGYANLYRLKHYKNY